MKITINTILFIITAFSVFASNRQTPVVQAVELVKDSVVNIRTEKIIQGRNSPYYDPFFDDFFGYPATYKTQSLGSGVIISNNGIIITNYHVVESASKIFIILPDNKQFEAKFIGGDKNLDIAVIKILERTNLKPAKIGTSKDLLLGETVIAIGNPYGFNSSLTTGVISNTKRILGDKNGFSVFIQTDALINPGNSGGPLINLDGEVIGLNTAVYKEAQGIGFAIPIDIVKRTLPSFLKYGKLIKSSSGFFIEERKLNNITGINIGYINQKSSAYESGLREGDKILSIDSIPINTIVAFKHVMRTFPIGETVNITILRNGSILNYKFKAEPVSENDVLSFLENTYGLKLEEKQNKKVYVSKSNIRKYIMQGDIIIGVNNNRISGLKDFIEQINNADSNNITLSILRNNSIYFVTLEL